MIPTSCIVCGKRGPSRCERHQLPGRWGKGKPRPERALTRAWSERRRAHLRKEPNCRRCGAPGREVDHILNRARGGTDSEDNLQTLCIPCHRAKSSHEGHIGRKAG